MELEPVLSGRDPLPLIRQSERPERPQSEFARPLILVPHPHTSTFKPAPIPIALDKFATPWVLHSPLLTLESSTSLIKGISFPTSFSRRSTCLVVGYLHFPSIDFLFRRSLGNQPSFLASADSGPHLTQLIAHSLQRPNYNLSRNGFVAGLPRPSRRSGWCSQQAR